VTVKERSAHVRPPENGVQENRAAGWIDIAFMQALSQHGTASLAAILSFRFVGWVAELFVTEEWLKAFLHIADQFVLVGLVLYLVVKLGAHLLKRRH
jgi:hypothetical protein